MNQTYAEARAKTGEYGVVDQVRHPLVLVRGLPGAKLDEIVLFDNDQPGRVMGLKPEHVEIVSLANEPIKPGSEVGRTGERLSISVGDNLRGKIVDPLGRSLLPGEELATTGHQSRMIESPPPPIGQRRKITKQVITGASLVDLLLPLGLGQREAIIGDQKTGKTLFSLSALKAYADAEHHLVVYAAIGKPWRSVLNAYQFTRQYGTADNVVIVASRADDSASLISLTPMTALTIAEYWRDQGHQVLVILDDLTTHAKFYREVALLARRFPGRESYPGDIFYLHARLLERAGNFIHPNGDEVSITCLPIAETINNDLTSYIVSNLISITDGHLLFDAAVFNKGRRPAIDYTLSVTRVGHQTQSQLTRQIHREVSQLLVKHQQAQGFTHFGAELSQALQAMIDRSNKILRLVSQPPYLIVPLDIQLTMAGMILRNWLTGQPDVVAGQYRDRLLAHGTSDQSLVAVLKQITSATDLLEFYRLLDQHKAYLLDICQTETVSPKK